MARVALQLVFAGQRRDNRPMAEHAFNIDDLSPAERLQLIEQIWDSLSPNPNSVPFTAPQKEEMDRRIDDLENGTTEGIPWEEVQRRLRKPMG